jgi:hypothetical protein
MAALNNPKPNPVRVILQSRWLRAALGAAIALFSVLFLGYFVYRNWATIRAYHWQIDYLQFALTALFHMAAFGTAIWGWHSIIARLTGVDDLFLNARIWSYSVLARRLPGVAWEIATRVVMYDQLGVSKAVVGLASLLEMMVISLTGAVLYIALTPFTLAYTRLGNWPLAVALILGLLLTNPRLVTYLVRRVKKDALPVALGYPDMLRWVPVYVLNWIIGGMVLFATVSSIYRLPHAYVLQVIADWILTGVLTSFITFVPSSLGLREVTFTLLLSRYMPEHVAVVAAILTRVFTTLYSLLWLLLITRFGKTKEGSTGCARH